MFYRHMTTGVQLFRSMKQLRVAVIGAGGAGLCALRHLTARPSVFEAVAFEQTDNVGGTWVYTDEIGTDKFGLPIHSSMYKNMSTNLPKEVMAFPDFPFREDLPSFIRHDEVFEYLDSYAEKFDLHKHIKFQTVVDQVKPILGEPVTWEVSYKSVLEKSCPVKTEIFDAVMVCNGHYSVPLLPRIPGMEDFTGQILHSHEYRNPELFSNRRVICLGAGSSGQDIGLEISRSALEVYLSHNKTPFSSPLPENVKQVPGIKRVTPLSVILTNDEEIRDVDVVLLCTGYHFSFPFLTKDCHLETEGERLKPLYKHLIHTEFPSLSFIGMCKVICPFPQFHCQVLFALAVLDGSLKLPPKEEMDLDTERDFQSRLKDGLLARYAHHMGTRQWDYNNDLAKIANFEPIPQVVQDLYNEVHNSRGRNLIGYKKAVYQLTGPNSFNIVQS